MTCGEVRRLPSVVALCVAALVGCGGSSRTGVEAAGGTTSTTAQLAARANEPRTADPTAARPPASAAPAGSAPAPAPTAATSATSPAEEKTPPSRIGARHVLVQWMGAERAASSIVRTREQALSLAREVHRRAKAGDDFARLAVEYSDEPGAANRGGSLGRFGKGQMVGAFEEAAFKLKVGEISDVVETGFGYHVIQRTE